jgi:hypothetical protein
MVGGAFIFVLSLLFGLVVAVPMSGAIATCAYPFLRILQAPGRQVFGVVGFSVGALACFGMDQPEIYTSALGFLFLQLGVLPVALVV